MFLISRKGKDLERLNLVRNGRGRTGLLHLTSKKIDAKNEQGQILQLPQLPTKDGQETGQGAQLGHGEQEERFTFRENCPGMGPSMVQTHCQD